MSDDVIRMSLAEALEGDRTDWARLAAMSDAAIDAAAAGDADSFDTDGASSNAPIYQIYADSKSGFRWRLMSAGGEVVAESGRGFPTRGEAASAIEHLRRLASEARSAA